MWRKKKKRRNKKEIQVANYYNSREYISFEGSK